MYLSIPIHSVCPSLPRKRVCKALQSSARRKVQGAVLSTWVHKLQKCVCIILLRLQMSFFIATDRNCKVAQKRDPLEIYMLRNNQTCVMNLCLVFHYCSPNNVQCIIHHSTPCITQCMHNTHCPLKWGKPPELLAVGAVAFTKGSPDNICIGFPLWLQPLYPAIG